MTSGKTKRSLGEAGWLKAGALPRLLAVLDRDGEEARVVGGAVRNALLGMPVAEIDVATTAVPDEVVRRVTAAGFKPVPTGIAHGTVTVVIDKHPFEVTTLRQDVETYGRHAKVAFGRDWAPTPSGAISPSMRCRRRATARSTTMSAGSTISARGACASSAIRTGASPKTICASCVSSASMRPTAMAIPTRKGSPPASPARGGLDQLSRERVRMELMKLLLAPHAAPTLTAMTDAGLLVRFLGGVPYLASFANIAKVEAAIGAAPDRGAPARRARRRGGRGRRAAMAEAAADQ